MLVIATFLGKHLWLFHFLKVTMGLCSVNRSSIYGSGIMVDWNHLKSQQFLTILSKMTTAVIKLKNTTNRHSTCTRAVLRKDRNCTPNKLLYSTDRTYMASSLPRIRISSDLLKQPTARSPLKLNFWCISKGFGRMKNLSLSVRWLNSKLPFYLSMIGGSSKV